MELHFLFMNVYYQFLYCRRDSKTISLESEEVKEHKKDNNFFPLAENYASQLESQNVSILELCIFPFMYVWLAKFWKMAFLWSSLGH